MDELRISPEEAMAKLRAGGPLVFVDARSAKAFEAGSEQIPGSIRVPPDQIDAAVGRVPLDRTAIAYCT